MTAETAIQGLYYWKNGQGLFALLQGKERYRYTDEGLKLLNPLASRPNFRINSLGLRDADVVMPKPNGLQRIAIIGGSSVMGEKAETNAARFSDILESSSIKGNSIGIDVINAGVAGAMVSDIGKMIDYIVPRANPDIIIIYPGGNDVSQVCIPAKSMTRQHAYAPQLPEWWLSTTTLRNRTAWLRPEVFTSGKADVPAPHINVTDYGNRLSDIVDRAKAGAQKVYLMTNARAFGPNQSPETLARASAQLRAFASCFSPMQLSNEFDIINEQIRIVARRSGVGLIDTDTFIPHDEQFFADSVHFSITGEHRAAELILSSLAQPYPGL